VRELCIALAHRWQPERLFVILTSYFDESGTHGGPVMTMAGVMGNARQWHRFQAGIDRLKKKHGFRTLHTTEFKHRSGQFAGWSPHQCVALLDDLEDITVDQLMEAVTFALDTATYAAEYQKGDKPRKLRLDTAYGLCFRECLFYLVYDAARRLGSHPKFDQTKMHVVLESGHRHLGDALRVFEEVRTELRSIGITMLASITPEGKDECDPLMVADFLAHTTLMRDIGIRKGAPRPPQLNRDEKGGVMHLEFRPDGLATLKRSLIQGVEARRMRATAVSSPSPDPASLPSGVRKPPL
jgi:hypothetical protein